MTAQMNALDANALPRGAAHLTDVTQQMGQLALDIEQWLVLSEGASLRVRQLGERLAEARAQHLRARPDRASAGADLAAETRAWEARGAALFAQLGGELDQARLEVARLGDVLGRAQAELARLQGEGVPAAELQDALDAYARAEGERGRLEAELEQFAASTRVAREDARCDDAAGTQRQADLLRGPVHVSPLSAAALEGAPPLAAPPPAHRARLDAMVRQVGEILQAPQGAAVGGDGRAQDPAAAALQARWAGFVADTHGAQGMDVGQLVQWVMREAYLATTDDLRFYAYRLRFFTDVKRRVREGLTRARTFQSAHQTMRDGELVLDGDFDKLSYPTTPEIGPDGVPRAREPEPAGRATSSKDLDAYIKDLEQQLNTIGDDAQLAQVDLQTMAQKQQVALQTISNLSKSMHETHMAIIRKIGS